MTMPDAAKLAAWPELLAQLDDEQYEALNLALNAMLAGNLDAVELADVAGDANMLGIAIDLAVMQGPDAVAAKRRADTRAGLVAQITELALNVAAIASDLEMAAGRLADFDKDPTSGDEAPTLPRQRRLRSSRAGPRPARAGGRTFARSQAAAASASGLSSFPARPRAAAQSMRPWAVASRWRAWRAADLDPSAATSSIASTAAPGRRPRRPRRAADRPRFRARRRSRRRAAPRPGPRTCLGGHHGLTGRATASSPALRSAA